MEVDPGKGGSPLLKVCGCYLLPSSCSPTSTDPIRCMSTARTCLVLHLQLDGRRKLFEIKPDGKSGLPPLLACLLWLWLPEVRVFVDFLHLVGVDINYFWKT